MPDDQVRVIERVMVHCTRDKCSSKKNPLTGIEGWDVGRFVGGGVVAGGGAPNKANFVVSLGPVHAPPLAKTSPSGNNVTV